MKNRKLLNIIFLFIVPILGSLIISSFPSLRLRFLGTGHDLRYHIQAIKGQAFLLNQKIFPIYINPLANASAGDCRFIVYPYLFTYIPAIIYNIINNIQISINLFIIFINIATFISTYKATMVIFKDKVVSVFAASFYLLCFYRVFNIYDRQAMGEYTALAFAPLVIAGFYNIFFDDKKRWYYLVMGITFLIHSHVITSFYYVIFVIIASILCAPRIIRDKEILKYYFLAGLLTILLNVWYLVPFLQYYIEAKIDIAAFGQYVKGLNNIKNTFIFDYHNSQRIFNCLGFESLFAVLMTFLLLSVKGIKDIFFARKLNDENIRINKSYIVAFVFLIIFCYYFLASIGKLNIGFLYKLYSRQQYLYRELGRGLPFIAMSFAYAASNLFKKDAPKIILILICLIVSSYTTITYVSLKITNSTYDVAPNITLPDYLFYSGSDGGKSRENIIAEKKDENMKNNNTVIIKKYFERNIVIGVSNDDIKLGDLYKGVLYYKLSYAYDYDDYAKQYIEFPLVAFTGYKATDDNGNDIAIERGDQDYIVTHLTDKKGEITVRFDPPILWKICNIISLITLIIIFILRIKYEFLILKDEIIKWKK